MTATVGLGPLHRDEGDGTTKGDEPKPAARTLNSLVILKPHAQEGSQRSMSSKTSLSDNLYPMGMRLRPSSSPLLLV